MKYKKVIAYQRSDSNISGCGIVFFELDEKDQKPETKIALVQTFPERLYPDVDFHGLPLIAFHVYPFMYRGENPIGDLSGMSNEELQYAIKALEMVESEEWLIEQKMKYEEYEL